MSVRERILTIRLMEKAARQPAYVRTLPIAFSDSGGESGLNRVTVGAEDRGKQ